MAMFDPHIHRASRRGVGGKKQRPVRQMGRVHLRRRNKRQMICIMKGRNINKNLTLLNILLGFKMVYYNYHSVNSAPRMLSFSLTFF